MDFNAGPVDVLVTTKLVYVTTLHLTCVSSSFVVGLLRHFLYVFSFLPLNSLSRKSSYMSQHFCSFYVLILCRDFVAAFVSENFLL